jgi:glycosyltransferase involved in cell wall biosynthesis
LNRTVIHISPFSTPHSGGFISSLKSLVVYAKTKGFRVVLIFPEAARNNRWACEMLTEGYVVYFLPPNQSMVALVNIIKQIAKNETAEIIHSHFSNFNIHACMASLLLSCGNKKIRTIWHFHSDWRIRMTFARRIKDFILYKILGQYVYGISVSENIKENIISRGMPRQRICYVPNGFDIDRVNSSKSDPELIRREIGIPEGAKVFLAFGWEPITKGIDLLLTAFEMFVTKHENAVLFLVGTENMKQYVDNWTCGAQRGWLVISDPRENVADFYKASDVFVSASRSEGFPYSVAEAMAAKLPIVSSNIPGLDWAGNVEGVVFFENCNANSLLQAMEKVLEWPETERAAKTVASNKFIVENYSVEKWSENIIEVYKTILDENHTRI